MAIELQLQIDKLEKICRLIEDGEEYGKELAGYLPLLNQSIVQFMSHIPTSGSYLEKNGLMVQILKDILYGMEQKDDVFLLDVLRYGLLEVFYDINCGRQDMEKQDE